MRHHTLNIRRVTFDVTHLTENIRPLTWDIKHQVSLITSEVRHQTTNNRHHTSDIIHKTSAFRHLTSDMGDLISDIRRLSSDVWHQTSDVWCQTSDVRFFVRFFFFDFSSDVFVRCFCYIRCPAGYLYVLPCVTTLLLSCLTAVPRNVLNVRVLPCKCIATFYHILPIT